MHQLLGLKGVVKGNLIQSCCSAYAVSKRHLNVCKPPVKTPFCIVMNTVLGSPIKKWHNPKSSTRSFGSDKFDQGSVQSFLSTQSWDHEPHGLSISMVACWTVPAIRHLSWAAESVAKPKMTTWAHRCSQQHRAHGYHSYHRVAGPTKRRKRFGA